MTCSTRRARPTSGRPPLPTKIPRRKLKQTFDSEGTAGGQSEPLLLGGETSCRVPCGRSRDRFSTVMLPRLRRDNAARQSHPRSRASHAFTATGTQEHCLQGGQTTRARSPESMTDG